LESSYEYYSEEDDFAKIIVKKRKGGEREEDSFEYYTESEGDDKNEFEPGKYNVNIKRQKTRFNFE